jgi:hypothetical protein
MDETRRAVLEAELGDALRERERLNHVIAYLSGRLGIPEPANDRFGLAAVGTTRSFGTVSLPAAPPPPPAASLPATPSAPPAPKRQTNGRPDPADLVRENEFFGWATTKAAVDVLRRVGSTRPLTTKELYAALVKGGVKVKDPGTLFRSMYRSERIAHVGKALWGLAEWYPDQNQQDEEQAQDANGTEAESGEADGRVMVGGHEERS